MQIETIDDVVKLYYEDILKNKNCPEQHRKIGNVTIYVDSSAFNRYLQGHKMSDNTYPDYIVLTTTSEASHTWHEQPDNFMELAQRMLYV